MQIDRNFYRGVNYANTSGGTGTRPIIGYQPPIQAQVYNYGRNNQLLNSYTGSYSAPIYGDLPGNPAHYGGGGPSDVAPNTGVGRLSTNVSSLDRGYTPAFGTGSISANAGSTGSNYPFSSPVPDLSHADLGTLSKLNISNLIYSVSAGGYLTKEEASNANSWYNKFGAGGGGDPAANSAAAAFYKYIGSLPTRPIGTPALNTFNSRFGGGWGAGPSYNSILGSTYQGPYGFGTQNPNYNQWGSYKGFGGGGGSMTGTAW